MVNNIIPFNLSFDTSILAGRVGPSTKEMYTRDFKAYLAFAITPEEALKASTLERWITYLSTETRMSPNTINRMISAVKKIIRLAAKQEYVSHEIAESFKHVDGVKVAALKKNLRQNNKVKIEPELMRKIIDSFDTETLIGLRNKAMFTTFASSGLRVNELATLQYNQIIKRKEGYLLIIHAEQGKNQIYDREAHISSEALEAIDAWLAARPIESEYIFTSFGVKGGGNPHDTHITPTGAWKVVKQVFAHHGLPGVKPHDLRRFVATQLIREKGFPIAQKALGHKNPITTAKYDLNEIEAGVTDNLF